MVTTTARAETLLALQRRVLSRIAQNTELDTTLRELCGLVEGVVPHAVCTIMLVDPNTGLLNLTVDTGVIDPVLRKSFTDVPVGQRAGSCSAAVDTGVPVFVGDTTADVRWSELQEIVEQYELRACWSYPIRSEGERAIGSFAICRNRTGEPSATEEELLRTAADLAEIAIRQDRTQEEAAQLRLAAERRRRRESMDVLAAGIAHDFNNLVTVILGNLEIAQSRLRDDHLVDRHLGEISVAARQAADLCQELLTYAGRGRSEFTEVNAVRLVDETVRLQRVRVPDSVKVTFDAPAAIPLVRGDTVQLRQVVMNLVTNAVEACLPAGGDVSVSMETIDHTAVDGSATFDADELSPGSYVAIVVADTGIGMSDETVNRMFDPYFTTKPDGRGLGLASTLRTLRAHGGAVQVRSRQGRGSRISVVLPALDRSEDPTSTSADPDVEWSGSGRVMLVDDEFGIRKVGAAMFSRLGLATISVGEGREAIDRILKAPTDLRAVFLDVSMTDIDGVQTFDALHQARPDIPVIILSARSEDEIRDLFAGRPIAGILCKPFTISDLRDRLQRVMT